MSLPPYIDRSAIHRRLGVIFPEGTPNRTYCVREMAASAVFVMLYIGAIEDTNVWLAPKHVMRMTAKQAKQHGATARAAYAVDVMRPGFEAPGERWYQDNSREPLRDETIRQGFITHNAVMERGGLPTTSSRPRYALKADFAALFDPGLAGKALDQAINTWQTANLSASARARVALMRRGAVTTGEGGVLLTFPNGETRRMAPGPSSVITKAVIEEFALRYLDQPAVLWVSESRAKVVSRDDELAATLGLRIAPDRTLPDIILVDLGNSGGAGFLLVFVEVVASDGALTTERQKTLLEIATNADFAADRVAFVTAYLDRSQPAFRKTAPELAWNSFAWFAAEPQHIMLLYDGTASRCRLETLMHGEPDRQS